MADMINYSFSSSSSSTTTTTTTSPCLSFPCPRSPPKYPDLLGKRRELAKVQMLEREIGFLQEELKSCEGLQLASRSCKEVDDFVGANPDPFMPVNQKIRRSYRIWKWLCGKSCFSLPWFCCFSKCSLHLETLNCCTCCCPSDNWCCCHRPRCSCHCLGKTSCRWCCTLPASSCPKCRCSCGCTWLSTKCTKVFSCFYCRKTCCNPCCLFY